MTNEPNSIGLANIQRPEPARCSRQPLQHCVRDDELSRGLMNFLSLRVKSEDSMFPSFPMWEINQVANKMELSFMEKMPLTHESFVANGRVQP